MSAVQLLQNHGCWPALTPRALSERARACVEVAGRACTSYKHTPAGCAALMFDATTSRASGAAATTVTASAVATAAAAVTRVSRRAISFAVIVPSPAQEAAAAAPPSAGRRGGVHYRRQGRQPKLGGSLLRLPPLPRWRGSGGARGLRRCRRRPTHCPEEKAGVKNLHTPIENYSGFLKSGTHHRAL